MHGRLWFRYSFSGLRMITWTLLILKNWGLHAPDTKNDGERHHPKTHLSAAHSVCFKPTSVTSFFCSLFFLTHILYLVCYRGVPRSKRIVRLRESRRTGPACTEGREVKKERELFSACSTPLSSRDATPVYASSKTTQHLETKTLHASFRPAYARHSDPTPT